MGGGEYAARGFEGLEKPSICAVGSIFDRWIIIVVFEGCMMKVSKNIIFLALFVVFLGNFTGSAFKFNPKEISRLVATVDPKTCNCVTKEHCKINIPYTSLLQIKCHEGTQVE